MTNRDSKETQTDPVKLTSIKKVCDSEVQVEPFEEREMKELLDLMNEYLKFHYLEPLFIQDFDKYNISVDYTN